MLVKICGITSEADALLAVGLGADAIGFVFAPSPRQVSAQAVRRIIERVPPEILTVGVFRNEAKTRVVDIVNSIGLRGAQLHGDETAEDTRWVAQRVPFTIKAFPVGHRNIGRIDDYGVETVLVDAPSPGSGEVFDWRLAEGVVDPARLIVSGGLHAGNVADAIAHLRPFGVDVSTGVESEPGRKDPSKVRAFVKAARAAAGETIGDETAGADDDAEEIGRPFDWREEG
ncbi:MAG: phosphoribosylanthranilate isomerase [Acidimicrobiales bacterium]